MKRIVEFPSHNGEVILVEVDALEYSGGTTRRGLTPSEVTERAKVSFEDALAQAQPVAATLCNAPYLSNHKRALTMYVVCLRMRWTSGLLLRRRGQTSPRRGGSSPISVKRPPTRPDFSPVHSIVPTRPAMHACGIHATWRRTDVI